MIGVGAALTAVLFATAPARAEPKTANSLQLGLGLRYGIEMNEGDFNPWGLGLGVQGGYTLPNAVYLGGLFEYFFGDSQELGDIKVKGNLWQLMAEAGYDIGLTPLFVLRPKVGAGIASTSLSTEGCPTGVTCADDSYSDFALAPGVTAMLFLPGFGLSLDARYDLVFAESETAKALILTAGIGF
jgi:hypothetical protein